MHGSLRMVKLVGVMNHVRWMFKRLGWKLLHLVFLLWWLFLLLYHSSATCEKKQCNILNPLDEHVSEEPAKNEKAINEQMIPQQIEL